MNGSQTDIVLGLSINTCTLTLFFVVVLNFEVMQQQQLIKTSSRPSYEGSYNTK